MTPPAREKKTEEGLSQVELEHMMLLRQVGACKNVPAFGVDFGELNYRVLGGLVHRGFVRKGRCYRYGRNSTNTGYWLTAAGVAAMDGAP